MFREGHFHEAQVEERLGVLGYPVTRQQEEVRLQITGKIKVVGHVDGVTVSPFADTLVVEIKTQSPEAWAEFQRNKWESGVFPKYKWQASVYMLALDMPLMLVRKNRSTGQIDTTIVERPFYSRLQIAQRVLNVEAIARETAEPPEKCDSQDGFFCPYRNLHEEAEFADVEPLRAPEIEELARQYVESGREEKRAKERREEAKRKLRAGLKGDRHRTASGVQVTFYKADNPPQLDKEKLEEFGYDVDFFTKRTKSERLRVTLPKGDDE